MKTQRHQIQRQVFEFSVSRRELADALHEKLPQWQMRRIEALVDACCSELSSPDRVHRLGRVEVDLGRISPGNLERAISDKLGPALREVLAKKIQAVEIESARMGEDPEAQARIELVSVFARTGTLPFWADAGNPKLVDETVGWLLARAPGDLRALVQWLVADRRAMERLVRHVDALRLLGLLKALVDARGSRVAEARAAEAWEALGVLGGKVPGTFEDRNARSSPGFSGAGGSPNSPATRAQTVGPHRLHQKNSGEDLNTNAGQQKVQQKVPGTFGDGDGDVSGGASQKVPGTFEDLDARSSPGFSGAGGSPNSPATRAQTVGPHRLHQKNSGEDLNTDAGQQKVPAASQKVPGTFGDVSGSASQKVPATSATVSGSALEKVPGTFGTAASSLRGEGAFEPARNVDAWEKAPAFERSNSPSPRSETKLVRGLGDVVWLAILATASSSRNVTDTPLFWQETLARLASLTGTPYATLLAAWLQASPKDTSVFATLVRELVGSPNTSAGSSSTFTGSSSTFTGSSSTFTGSSSTFTGSSSTFTGTSPSDAGSSPSDPGSSPSDPGSSPSDAGSSSTFTGSSSTFTGSSSTFTGSSPSDAGSSSPVAGSSSTYARTPTSSTHRTSSAISPPPKPKARPTKPSAADPDEVYVDTAGVVLLWPFLVNFFQRLGLINNDKAFVDEAARHRGILLLHWLTTAEWNPPEFRLPLSKTLCGVPLDEVLCESPELTDIEQTEGQNLLGAVLEHAKTLGALEIDEFRRNFLRRRGVLRVQNNTWLLRVERAPYDLVLRGLPWPLQWISLPWMQAPLFVEWVK